MINRENLIKIGRAGGKTSNHETPEQIRRVGISAMGFGSYSRNCHKMNKDNIRFSFILLHAIYNPGGGGGGWCVHLCKPQLHVETAKLYYTCKFMRGFVDTLFNLVYRNAGWR